SVRLRRKPRQEAAEVAAMLAAWGRFVFRRRWWVLGISGLLLVASAVIAAQGGKLESGGLITTSESGKASQLIERELPRAGGSTLLISKDAHAVAVDVAVKDELAVARDYYPELRALVRSDRLNVQATGVLAITNGFNVVLQEDLRRAETVSLPLALILLLIV